MENSTKVKLVKQIEVATLNDEKAMVDFETGNYYLLKGSATDIWDFIQTETTIGEIIDKLLEIYDVNPEECKASVVDFLEELKSKGLIELS
ncbi:Coenzyme PQQ synthesis protein D (PqqD) [Acetitomaculum ruminis DSM 5522]|uniref:Coenzyme PQQ synthesis protein D (PqqD) n=1 Tax=Acetitomaculum ruminis DSM 5522 TaxID=1120918 RepID=A0A1I0YNJ2_9FIRM|nr:PqqD family protein [Acetitomaculum ruminis]SFB14030.1 Coenzyme PQQ synthesis protein D (PqqD) [Acetitomaculum ruminis DSM 5522]